jgi:diguanylate cyclase (GGDEF)-like protein
VPAHDLEKELTRLKIAYLGALPAKLASLEAALDQWTKSVDAESREEAHRIAHSLAGGGATFGLPELSTTARELAEWLEPRVHSGEASSLAELAALAKLAAAVGEAAGQPILTGSVAPAQRSERSGTGPMRKKAWVVGSDQSGASELVRLFGAGGYEVRRASDLTELGRIRSASFAQVALVASSSLPESIPADLASHLEEARVPIAVFGPDGSVRARLLALRQGAAQLFTAPYGPATVLAIDDLIGAHNDRPYRVLIVDDEREQALALSAHLRNAGMLVECSSDPLAVMTVFEEFRPELVILDIHMPECSGIELARVLRQHEELLAISIIFVSGEHSWQVQREAMQAGGEDYLVKPISPEQLILAVRAHGQRLRRLEGRIASDGLTGLCNQRTFRDRLRTEVARARRESVPLSVAALDLDHFKSVNDTHGHPAGDRVLKTLSVLLRETLRQTDTIGRIGGEEFAVILPQASAQDAVHVMDEIRRTFQGITQASSFGDFRVTLSCGVATLAPGQDAEVLLDAADRALYRAKQLGRNRVEVPPTAALSSIPAPDKPRERAPLRRPSSTRMRRVRGPG